MAKRKPAKTDDSPAPDVSEASANEVAQPAPSNGQAGDSGSGSVREAADAARAKMKGAEKYDESSIEKLEGIEAIRTRPGMYIGSTDVNGLHHMINEVVDNSIDEFIAGYGTLVHVRINADGSISVLDDGRGVPVGVHSETGRPTVESIFTELHMGGKFKKDAYKVSGGLHGVGVTAVNALSEWLEVEVHRDGATHTIAFERGVVSNELKKTGKTDRRGTKVTFMPDHKVFETLEFSFPRVAKRLSELAYLNPGVTIRLTDEREEPKKDETYKSDEGLVAFVRKLNDGRVALHNDIISFSGSRPFEMEGLPDATISVDIAMQWTDAFSESIEAYCNNIHNMDGGTHVSGLRSAVTRCVNDYIKKNRQGDDSKKSKAKAKAKSKAKSSTELPSGDDIREGLTAVISLKHPNPQFVSQTKGKLGNSEVDGIVTQIVNEMLDRYFEETPRTAKLIADKSVTSMQARNAARAAAENIKRKTPLFGGGLPGKLWDCRSRKRDECELFIVEGQSAGGTAKEARDHQTQAILPLKGKILNVEKARFEKIIQHEELSTLIKAIGTGTTSSGDFEMDKLRYGKVVIMTDADDDGSHIRTLLLTFFFRHMRPLVEGGKIYCADPPLYRLGNKQRDREKEEANATYVHTQRDWDAILLSLGLSDARLLKLDGAEVDEAGNGKAKAKAGAKGKKDDGDASVRRGIERVIEGVELRDLLMRVQDLERYDKMLQKKGISLARFCYLRDDKLRFPYKLAKVDGQLEVFYDDEDVQAYSKAHPDVVWRTEDDEDAEVEENAVELVEFHKTRDDIAKAVSKIEALGFEIGMIIPERAPYEPLSSEKAPEEGLYGARLSEVIAQATLAEEGDSADDRDGDHDAPATPAAGSKKAAKKKKSKAAGNGKPDKTGPDPDAVDSDDALSVRKSLAIDRKAPLAIDSQRRAIGIHSLLEALKAVRELGLQNRHIQRFKGLGEMNKDQLWKTTMDPDNRNLTKVMLEDAAEADGAFYMLMGDPVDPRAEYIRRHALEVKNLDV